MRAVGVVQQLIEAPGAVFSQAGVLIGDGRSCLSVACEKGQLEVVLFLVRGATNREFISVPKRASRGIFDSPLLLGPGALLQTLPRGFP